MITIIRNSILFLASLLLFIDAYSQDFLFLPDGDNQIYYSNNIKINGNSNSQYTELLGPATSAYEWADMKANPTNWNSKYKFKSVSNYIRVGVDHRSKVQQANYKYKIVLSVKGFTNPAPGAPGVTIGPFDFLLEYNKDALESYNDLNVLKLPSSFYSFETTLMDVLDMTTGVPVSVPRNQLAENFKIETQVLTQRYDIDAGNMKDLFINSVFNVDNQSLDVYWGHMPMIHHKNNPGFLPFTDAFKPVKYELEWQYIDDYVLNSNGTRTYKFSSSSFNIPYDFRHNSTRIQTNNNNYSIPMVYGHGAIIFRIRKVRPDETNFSETVYYPWNLEESGTLTQSSFYVNGNNVNTSSPMVAPSQCVFINTTPFINDSLNWQYNISFAEEGKSKHVINYFDGMGKNRQTQTKINSDNNYVIGIDNIYDFEGRPGITTLPTPVISQNIKYKPNLSLNAATSQPYKAADFDTGCGTDSIAPFSSMALSNIYYSSLNPDKAGMQKYVPDAEGYPMIETRYAADYTDKVQWQGGAGKEFQRWKGRGTNYVYSRAGQRELNRLLGSEGGYAQYYPKQTIIDPNGQASFSITDAAGKVIATGLSGTAPDSSLYPLEALNSLPTATYRESDVLKNFPQEIGKSYRNAQVNYFNEALSQNSLLYKLKIPPFPTCNNQFIKVSGEYKIRLFDECNVETIIEMDEKVNSNGISTASDNYHYLSLRDSAQIVPGKYTVQKELTFSDSAITGLASEFVNNNNGHGMCYSGKEPFVRQEIEQSKFPCEPGEEPNNCDVLKRQMMQELYPGAKYGQYLPDAAGKFSLGASNSIFTMILAPLDSNWVLTNNPSPGDRCTFKIRENYWNLETGNSSNETLNHHDWSCINTGSEVFSVEGTYPYQLPPNSSQYCPPIHYSELVNERVCRTLQTSVQQTRCLYEVSYLGQTTHTYTCNGQTNTIVVIGAGETEYIWAADTNLIPSQKLVPPGNLGQLCNQYHSLPYVLADRYINPEPIECIYYVPPHFRYQSACLGETTTIPVKRISPTGLTYTSNTLLKDVTPDMLIASFNDEIAETLLPLHPEYCKLQACDASSFETILSGIETYDEAVALGMHTLTSILSKDPLSQSNPNATNAPFSAYDLSHFAMDAQLTGANANILKRLDTMAIAQAYCGSNSSQASLHCEYYTYAAQIGSMNLTDPAIKELYIKSLKALYLANRNTRKQLFTDGIGNDCAPCDTPRMDVIGNPVFPKVFDNAGQFAVDSVPPAIRNSINNYINNPTTNIPNIVQDELDLQSNKCADQVAAIVNDLRTCVTHPVILGDLAYDLSNYCNTHGIEYLSPAALRGILIGRLGSLTDLCQPFVAKYKVFEPDAAILGDYVSQSPAMYSDISMMLNRIEFKNSVLKAQPSGSAVLSFDLNPTNTFEAKIAAKLGVSTSANVNVRGFIENVTLGSGSLTVVKLRVYSGSNMEHIYLAPRDNATSVFPHPTASLNFYNASSVLEEITVMEGGIADKLAFISLQLTVPPGGFPSFPNPLNYTVWTSSIPFLKLKNKDGLEDCINCEQLRRAMVNYWADTNFYSLPKNTKHPLFFESLKNHLNYTLGATQTVSGYQDLMEGCGMSDKFLFRNAPAAVEYTLPTGAGGNIFSHAKSNMQTLRFAFPDISFQHYAFRRSNGTVYLRIDLSSVPKDSLGKVKQHLMGLVGSPKYMENGFDAELFKSGSGAPSLPGMTVSTEGVTYMLSEGITFTNINWHKITFSNHTIAAVNSAMDALTNYVSTDADGAYYQVHYGYRQFRTDDYNSTQRTAYLNYVYGMTSADEMTLSDNLAPTTVRSNVSSLNFLRAKLSYNDPWKENEKRHLYYWDSAQSTNAGYLRVINSLSQVSSTLNFSKLFPLPNTQVNVSGQIGTNNASVKAFRLSNGNAWIRIFDAQNKLYNIYLVPSAQMAYPAEQYEWVPTVPGAQIVEGAGNIYRFNITMRKGSHYVKVEGYADFPIGNGSMISNVVLSKNANTTGKLIDTLTCESGILEMASAQGLQRYHAYIDSIKQRMGHDMRVHFATNAVDTLILGTREQQYHYTLYYYDKVGNLTKTVPPQGVNPMPDASQNDIDYARSQSASSLSLTQKAVHNKSSLYRYNSMNLPIWQQTPDGGESEFFYDLAGRLAFSQNAKQKLEGTFSYILYDGQGRIDETGILDATKAQIVSYVTLPINNGIHDYTPWVKSKTRTEVVATRYDEPILSLGGFDMLSAQQNLRKRVSAVLYSPSVTTQQGIDEYYHYATHFSYDAMGNVNMLVHDNPYLNYMQQRFKRIDYDYDLLSGKVNMLSYNRGFADQFYQRYNYDADNRIIKAESSKDGLDWERDASYTYYKQGPLAEIQLGELSVQGIQYAYTIQGWLKAINGDVLNKQQDMGQDGLADARFPTDVVAHALDYYKGDYKSIDQTKNVTHTAALTKSLYDGNIARQTTTIIGMENLVRDYKYDQLQRIKSATYATFDNMNYAVANLANAFKNTYGYDADGNLQTLERFNRQAQQIDNFTYAYSNPSHNNKLSHVADASGFAGGNDLKPGQVANNYTYDVLGNLKTDRQEGIKDIIWNSHGKIERLIKGDVNADTMNMIFHYDGMGNRIRKDVWREEPSAGGSTHARYSDIYVRDAQGNILAVYKEYANVDGDATIDWLNSQMSNVVSGPVLSAFFAHQFGGNGSFSTNLLSYSLENAQSWTAQQLSERSPYYYMVNSNALFNNVLNQKISASWTHLKEMEGEQFIGLFNYKNEDLDRTANLLAVSLNNRNIRSATLNKLVENEDDLSIQLFLNLPEEYRAGASEEVIGWGKEGRIGHLSMVLDNAGGEAIAEAFRITAMDYPSHEFLNSWLKDRDIYSASTLDREREVKTAMTMSLSRTSHTEGLNTLKETLGTWIESEDPEFIDNNYTKQDLLNVVFNSDRVVFLESYLEEMGIEGITHSINRIPGISTLSYSNLVVNAVSIGQLHPSVLQYVNTPSPQNIEADTMWLAEHHLYGSSRLGIKQYDKGQYQNVYVNGQPFVKGINVRQPWYSLGTEEEIKSGIKMSPLLPTHYLTDTFRYIRKIGSKFYELTDHLGNVLATVLDRKTGYGATGGQYAGFNADVASATDYFPFGMEMPGRTVSSEKSRFGFNGQEKDNEFYGTGVTTEFDYRSYDSRIARFKSVDPLYDDYPWNSTYAFAENSPIKFIDLEGLEKADANVEKYYKNSPVIDMSCAPEKSAKTAFGHPRNGRWFWTRMLKEHPEMFDEANVQQIKQGKSPIVNKQWIKYNCAHIGFEGDKLLHHHIDQGKMAVGIPKKLHLNNFKALHPFLKGFKVKGIGGALGFVSALGDISAAANGNPDAMFFMYGRKPKLDVIQKDWMSDLYFTPIEIKETHYPNGKVKEIDITIEIFSDYIWDDDDRKYRGINLIESRREVIQFDTKGNVKSSQKLGTEIY